MVILIMATNDTRDIRRGVSSANKEGLLPSPSNLSLIHIWILKFPCTNNEEYIVCVHSDNKYESGGCRPVSYTHLDVYKRQVQGR